MRRAADSEAHLSLLGQLYRGRRDDLEVLFICILNRKVSIQTRMLAAWCIYEVEVSRAKDEAPLASVPDGVLKELDDLVSACLAADPQAWRRFYRWPQWERKSKTALKHAHRLAREEFVRRYQHELSLPNESVS